MTCSDYVAVVVPVDAGGGSTIRSDSGTDHPWIHSHLDVSGVFLNHLTCATTTVTDFLAWAAAFKQICETPDVDPASVLFGLQLLLAQRARVPRIMSPRVALAIRRLEDAVDGGLRPTENRLADGLAIHPSHLGRLIKTATGLGFREWRLGITIRGAARQLSCPDACVASAAYALGYSHASQLSRDFHHVLGMWPKAFRNLWRNDQVLRALQSLDDGHNSGKSRM